MLFDEVNYIGLRDNQEEQCGRGKRLADRNAQLPMPKNHEMRIKRVKSIEERLIDRIHMVRLDGKQE